MHQQVSHSTRQAMYV